MTGRGDRQSITAAITIYEVHLGSWMRVPEEGNRLLTYREAAPRLATYAAEMGFTHVELLPVFEHPAAESWATRPSACMLPRLGSARPMTSCSSSTRCTRRESGSFSTGCRPTSPPTRTASPSSTAPTFTSPPTPKAEDPGLGTYAYNFESPPVVNFLTANALFWLEKYHFDGLRVDGVESMIRLDFMREPGTWQPNSSAATRTSRPWRSSKG